jgi:carbon storage regulator CsrA
MEDLTMVEQGSLTFTRKPGDCFAIGEDITVSIVRVKGDNVRVNIRAPKDLRICRDDMRQDCDATGQHEADGHGGG